jgi:hypothetical protein
LLDNLNEKEKEALKQSWIGLINRISEENRLSIEELIDSSYGDELFCAIGSDNPDVLILRWLRAKKWNVDDAVQQLIDTLQWRHQFNIKQILAQGEYQLNQEEIESGKTFIIGKDKLGRPVSYIQVTKHIKGQFSDESTQLIAIFTIETARKLLDSGHETASSIIDLNGFSYRNLDYEFVKFSINLLENHYPESLGVALVINAPYLFYGTWNIIKHWLDPVVRSKIIFLKDPNELSNYVDVSVLPKQINGELEHFKYIPPTEQDKQMFLAFRNDKDGEEIARRSHRRAAKKYLEITLQWANDTQNNQHIIKQRKRATKKLRNAFEQLIPYVSTKTHYHRVGIINEPIFDIAYEQLLKRNEEYVTMF